MPERRRLLLAVFAVAWLAIVFVATFAVHKPIHLEQVQAWGLVVVDLVAVGLLGVTSGGIGLWLLGSARPPGRAERVAWSAGLGLGVTALATLALGALGAYRAWLTWLLLIAVLLLLRRESWTWVRMVFEMVRRWRPGGRETWLWWGYCGLVFSLALIQALLPPTAWDALVYHLTGPKLYLQAGRLVHPVDLPYLGFPQLGEMLFTLCSLLGRPSTAQLVSLLFGCLLALGTYGLVAQRWGRPAGALAVAILFSAETIASILGWAYVDIILMFYTVATYAALSRSFPDGQWRWTAVAGLFAGMGLATKYTAVLVPAGGLLLILATFTGSRWRTLGVFGLACALFATPWLIKNWALTGNPIYPFFLPGLYWDHHRAWWYGRPGTGLIATAPEQVLLAPWYATVWGVEGAAGFSATIGPLFLALVPLVLFTWRFQAEEDRRALGRMILYVVPGCLLWLVGISVSAQLIQTRLLFPVFPFLAAVAAAGVARAHHCDTHQFRLAWVLRVLVAFSLALSALSLGLSVIQRDPLRVTSGLRSQSDYLTNQLGWHVAAMERVNELPAGSRVLFLWEPRSFYCQRECLPDALLDRWWHERQTVGDPGAIATAWRAAGVSHLLLFRSGYRLILSQGFDPIGPDDQAALEVLLTEEAILLQDLGGVYQLYRLEP